MLVHYLLTGILGKNAGGGGTQTLNPTIWTNTSSFGSHVIEQVISPTAFTDADVFGTPTVSGGATTDRSRYDHIEIPTRPKPRIWEYKHGSTLPYFRQQIEEVVATVISDEPKSKTKPSRKKVAKVVDLIGSGLLANVQPTQEIRQAISLALTDQSGDVEIYARIAEAIQRQLDEQDDEDVITLLLAA